MFCVLKNGVWIPKLNLLKNPEGEVLRWHINTEQLEVD